MKNTPTLPPSDIPPDGSTPPVLVSIDGFMEEINVVRIEGRYFCFDVREAGRRGPNRYVYQNRDGREITIQTSVNGYPSILAYRILQAIFRQITLEGKPYPHRIVFTKREIGRLIGRDIFGGRDSQQIQTALFQLQDTIVSIKVDGKQGFDLSDRFSLISRVTTITERAEHNLNRHGTLHALSVEIHPAIMDSIRKGHIAIFNWGILEALEPVQAALYKRLYVQFSFLFEKSHHKKEQVTFDKRYEDVCGEWLGGLAPHPHKSLIQRQLKPHLDALGRVGMLRSWSVEAQASGGWKLNFRPGKGFFQDYEIFYRHKNLRQLQFTHTSNEVDYLEPIDVVSHFFEELKGSPRDKNDLEKGDIEFARDLLKKHTRQELFAFIAYAIAKAASTNFKDKIVHFRALRQYLPDWELMKEEQARQAVATKAKVEADLVERRQKEYENYIRKHVARYLDALPEAERNALRTATEQDALTTNGRGIGFDFFVNLKIRARVLEKAPVPSFEDWLKAHN